VLELDGPIREFLDDTDAPEQAKHIVRRHQVLPLFVDMGGLVGIRSDATLVQFDWKQRPGEAFSPEQHLGTIALVLGAKKYSILAHLVPERPPMAQDCGRCGGTGRAFEKEAPPGIPCTQCFCRGWVESSASS
jgi:hypothetical protein